MGRAIGHSLSPRLHQALLRLSGRHGTYQLLDSDAWQLAVDGLLEGRFDGLNVTTPFKNVVAERCLQAGQGPVNCVRSRDGQLQGWSSDGPGFVDALTRLLPLPDRPQVLLLGTGGAAESLVPSLAQRGCTVWLRGRQPHSGQDWPQRLPVRLWPGLQADAIRPHNPGIDLVIHASRWGHGSLGAPPQQERLPWQDLPWASWAAAGTPLVDIVYSANQPTWMEQLATSENLPIVQGFGRSMLAAQAAHSFAYWTGELRDWRDIAGEINAPV